MGIWRVARHAPGRPDSPPVLRRRAPSNPPSRSPRENKERPDSKELWRENPYSLPEYKFLDLPHDVIRGVAPFRLRVHTLRYETATWNDRSSSNCDLCAADDDVPGRMNNMSSFIAHIPRWSLSAGNMLPSSHRQDLMMFPFSSVSSFT
eukprot:320945-Pelagomonas_calceolata.AAC.1